MDRRWTRACALIPILLAVAASHGPDIPIREARWLAPDALYRALTREPAECLVMPGDAAGRRSVAIGRSLFRAPLLLGGQAARAGISCATCHRNGRGNADFFFPGVSGAPGTADVTSSLMSSHRGDQIANPVPIPDLGGPRDALKVSQDAQGRTLEHFIRGLVVEEFDGAEPPPEALAALAAYVRALRPEGCRGADRPITLTVRLAEVDAAIDLARQSEGEMRRLLLGAARSTLGVIDERFQRPGLDEDRRLLLAADRDLQAIRSNKSDFAGWDRNWPERKRRLQRDERRSLFSNERVRQALR